MTTRACRLLRAPKPVFRSVHGRSARRPVRVTNTGSSSQGGGGVPVEFRLPQKVPYGRTAFLVGSCEQLGVWNLDGAKELNWTNGDVWQGTVELPVGEEVEYKYVMVDVIGNEKGGQEWQKGPNLRLRADDRGMRLLVTDSWVMGGEHEVETKPLSELDVVVPIETISAEKEVGQQGGATSTAQPTVSLDFSIEREVEFGNKMFVVGSTPALGAWSLSKACKMKWADGHVWKASVQVPAGETVEYKYAVLESSGYVEGASVQWQEGPNKVLEVPSDAERVEVHDGWKVGVEADVRVEHKKAVEAVAPPPPAPPAEEDKPILKMEEMEIVTPSGQILSGMSVRELKDQLRELGLSPTGRKMALVGRLSEYLANGGS